MEKIILEEYIKEHIDKNFDLFSKYLAKDLKVFTELKYSVEEVIKCLILEFDKAAIALTSNLLMRLLKLTLFYNDVGIKTVSIEKWIPVFAGLNQKYGSLTLD